ncbi:MAG: hypothetical protein H7Z72_03270 [Bacteroidetes bacterium]|nr:hypothetical protein [Fibrella sp.]
MKIHSFFGTIATVVLLTLAAGCSTKSDADPQPGTGPGSATIKLTQNGQVVTEFKTADAVGVGGGGYSLAISSTDEKHNLTLSIDGDAPGTYPFITKTQPLTDGKANFLYQSDALPEIYAGTTGLLSPDTGEMVLKTATKTRCSGTFKGSGKNTKDGKTYTLEGTFDTPVY